jgi:hypothetical protein
VRAESVWRREGFALIPWSAEARDALWALKEGGQCVGNICVAQRPEQLPEYWGLCSMVGKRIGKPREGISNIVLLRMGLFDLLVDSMGVVRLETRSVSKQNMDAVDFKSFMDHARLELSEMIPADPKAMQREFLEACRRAT